MLNDLKNFVADVMKVPPEPHDPMGDVRSLRVFRPSKQYLYYRYLGWGLGQLLVLFVLFMVFGGMAGGLSENPRVEHWVPIAVGIVGAGIFLLQFTISAFVVWLDYEMRWYKISDRSLRIRYGVWNVREHTVTFANIQNTTVTQGPVQNMFGIADVKVDTAGGGNSGTQVNAGAHFGLVGMLVQAQSQQQMLNMHQAVFRGVDNAEEIRDLMMERLRRARDAGLGEPMETADSSTGPSATHSAASSGIGSNVATVNLLTALREEAAALRLAAESVSR